jgi:hypothetical protein
MKYYFQIFLTTVWESPVEYIWISFEHIKEKIMAMREIFGSKCS